MEFGSGYEEALNLVSIADMKERRKKRESQGAEAENLWFLRMKFTRYSKFKGLDISGINLGDLMESLSDSLLDSGYDDDYYWTRERRPQDTSWMLSAVPCSGTDGTGTC